jgi:A/G-specific adenine glycosylase
MLQQIQLKRAVPFYERFPTVNALTEAPLAEAIRVWEDLDRYRRVVYLYKTARRLVREHGGGIPSDPEQLVKLPGIGPYSAGAMAASRSRGTWGFVKRAQTYLLRPSHQAGQSDR